MNAIVMGAFAAGCLVSWLCCLPEILRLKREALQREVVKPADPHAELYAKVESWNRTVLALPLEKRVLMSLPERLQ